MGSYLMELRCDVWKIVINGYKESITTLSNRVAKKLGNHNARAINEILGGLSKSFFFRVKHCNSTKEIWDKLEIM